MVSPFDPADLPQQIPLGWDGLRAIHPIVYPWLPGEIPVGSDGLLLDQDVTIVIYCTGEPSVCLVIDL